MFSVLLRAGITFAVGAILIYVWALAMDPLIDTIAGFGAEESNHAQYLTQTVDWMSLIVLLSLLVLIVYAAVRQRDATTR